jgi:hypothetical protein
VDAPVSRTNLPHALNRLRVVKTAIVLASGPSLTVEQIDAARRSEHFTIVVNRTYQKFLDADVLYAGDFMFWRTYMADIRATFKGKCWTQDNSVAARWPHVVQRMRGGNRDGLGTKIIHTNGNSGMQSLNLAYLWGYERIVMLGFDMKLGSDGAKHHHPDHPAPCVQAMTFFEWIHKCEKVARDFREKTHCEVINCTPESALTCFPMKDWREVLA